MIKWLVVSVILKIFLINFNDIANATRFPNPEPGRPRNFRRVDPSDDHRHTPRSQRPLNVGPFGKQGPSISPFPSKDEWQGPFGSFHRPPLVNSPFPGRPSTTGPPLGFRNAPSSSHHKVIKNAPGGCDTVEGFRFAGEVWYANGCRRRKCIHFRGSFFTETDACDTEIYNPTYKCIIEVDTQAHYPHCCPRYRCNPDNLGNDVK